MGPAEAPTTAVGGVAEKESDGPFLPNAGNVALQRRGPRRCVVDFDTCRPSDRQRENALPKLLRLICHAHRCGFASSADQAHHVVALDPPDHIDPGGLHLAAPNSQNLDVGGKMAECLGEVGTV